MAFGLHYDIPDRAVPDALRILFTQHTEALETLLHYAETTAQTMPSRGDMPSDEKARRVDAFAHDVFAQLAGLDEQRRQIEQHLRAFQGLLRQQGNPILAYTLERVKEVMQANIAKATEQIHAMVSRME